MSRLLALFLCTLTGFSQTITASLEGDIKDATGAAVPSAKVQVINTDTGVITRAVT